MFEHSLCIESLHCSLKESIINDEPAASPALEIKRARDLRELKCVAPPPPRRMHARERVKIIKNAISAGAACRGGGGVLFVFLFHDST